MPPNDQMQKMYEWDGPETWLDIVDSENRVIGKDTFVNVHQNGLKHRTAVVVIRNDQGDFLLQQRSAHITYPLLFDIAVGGHVESDETPEQNARKEMQEELRLDIPLQYCETIYNAKEKEFIAIYEAIYNEGTPDFDKDEVNRLEWMSEKELTYMLDRFPYLFTSTVAFIYNNLYA